MGNEDSKLRRLFESFDHDNDGQLGLNEILQINKIHDLKYILKSPSLLYQIDEGQDGKLNFEEFAKLLRHLKSKNKTKVKEKKKDKKIWTAVSEEDAKDFQLSRSTETPMFTNSNYGGGDEDKIKGKKQPMSDEEKENEKLEEEKQVINEENKNVLINILSTAKGRRRYMNWLFRLADVEGKGSINSDQLAQILKALQLDGVNIKELSYDQSQEKAISGIAKKLMEEYDGDNDGRITQEEFLIFADLVVKNYQLEEEEEMIMGRYVLKRKLGSGASGVVKLAWDNKRNEKVAIKIIKKGTLSDMSRVDKEIQAMLMLSHPSIVSLYKVLQSDTEVYLVMEYCSGGTLADYVQLKPLSEELSRFYFAQVVEGVRYCHISGVVHRDLKLENLLLTKNGNIKITDFGHVGIFTQGWDMFSTTMVGSLFHLSPEQIEGKIYSGEKIDIWALGVVLYRMIVGKPPFYDKNVNKLVENIKNIKLEIPENPPISEQAKKLMASIFKAEPKDRISIEEIQRHEWVINGEKSKPSLERMEMILGKPDENSQEEAWKVLTFVIKNKMNMTFHEKLSKTPHILKTCNCIFPAKDLKLSIHIKKMETLPSTAPSSLNILLHTITSSSYHSPKTLSFSPKNGSGNGSNGGNKNSPKQNNSPKQSHSPKQTLNSNRLSGEGSNVVYRNNPLPKLVGKGNNPLNNTTNINFNFNNNNEEKNISDKENLNRSKSLSLTSSPIVNRVSNQSSSLHNITVSNNFNQFSTNETSSILPPNSLLSSTHSTNDTFAYNDDSGTSYNSGNVRSIFSNSLEDFTFSPILLSLHKHDKKEKSSSNSNTMEPIKEEREGLKVRGMNVEGMSVDTSTSQSLKLSNNNTNTDSSLISSTDTLNFSDLSLLTNSRNNIDNTDFPNDHTDIPPSKTNISITTTNISVDNSDSSTLNPIIPSSNSNLLNVNNNHNNVNNTTFSGSLKRTSNSERQSHHSSLPVQQKSPNNNDFLHSSHLHMLSSNEKPIPTPPGSNNKGSTSENYFFIFDLREGDCWDFRNTVERIKNHYSSSFQLFKKGLLQLEEEENKDLFSSEPTLSFNALSSLSSSPNQKDKKKRLSKNLNELNKVSKSSPHKKKGSTGNSNNNIIKDELPNYNPLQQSSDSSPNSPTKSISPNSPTKSTSPERKKSSVVSLPISDDEGPKTSEKNWKSKSTGGFITRDSKIPKKDKQKDREKEDKKDRDRKEKDKKKDKDKEKKKNSESK